MDLRDLRYFEVIAETAHLGVASDRLGRTKPALSKCIRRLEDDIGARLFRKQGRGIVLTDVGAALLKRAVELRLATENALAEVREVASGQAGNLRIGTGPTVERYILPPVLDQMASRFPNAQASIFVGLGERLRQLLHEGSVDVIASSVLPGDAENFAVEPLCEDHVTVLAREGHPLLSGQPRLADLLDYKWILPLPTLGTRQWIDWAFTARGLPTPTVQVETASFHMLPSMVRGSDLLTFAPRVLLSDMRPSHRFHEIVLPETTMSRTIALIYPKNRYRSPILENLIALVRDYYRRARA